MSTAIENLLEEQAIIKVLNELVYHIDRKTVDGALACFCDEVLVDYTSLFGGNAETKKAQDVIDGWKALIPGFKSTQHFLSNFRITLLPGNEADAWSYVSGVHYLPNESGNNTWTVNGWYDQHLVKTAQGWKVNKMRLVTALVTGNGDLIKLAMEEAKKAAQ